MAGVGIGGDDEDDLRLGSDCAGPLDIEGVLEQIVERAGGSGMGSCRWVGAAVRGELLPEISLGAGVEV